jgi:phenylacetate-CoA ligase
MADWKLQLYHRLPAPARAVAASLRGRQLRRWRYGRETEALVEAALAREAWSPAQWQARQEERLAYVLHRAATCVPYYRAQWEERRRKGDRASWERLENWPILEKEPLRRFARAFVADDCDPRRMFHDHTSGTSGKSLDLWYRREAVREWYALAEARWRRWYGVSRDDRWGILGGQLVTPVAQRRPPFWVWNGALRQLYLSSYHLAPDLILSYLDAIAEHRLTYLLGYTSALHALALGALRARRAVPLKVVVANAEPVFDHQRRAIEEAFQCPVRETYGMAETVAAASECEAGRLHLWPEAGRLEVISDDRPASVGEVGDLICTGLLNSDMPLIRYRVGDRAAVADAAHGCECGRRLPQLAALEGRADDVLYTRDGRRVGRLDPVFKAQLPVREAQIIQESLDRVRVRYVPDERFDAGAARSISERLRARMGPVEVELEAVAAIPRGAGGKFRAVVCQLPPEQVAELRRAAAPPRPVEVSS